MSESHAHAHTQEVLVSPLTRAFQTALVALDNHPTVTSEGVTLYVQFSLAQFG